MSRQPLQPRSLLLGLTLGLLCASLSVASARAQCDAPIDVGRGPIAFEVPPSYDPATPAPLIVLLHGRGTSGAGQEAYWRLAEFADELGFLYAYPDGTLDPQGALFWNGTDACCDFFGSGVDDSSYLRELIEAVRLQCNVDPYRIYFAGHSNGGFMAYRMACDHADVVAGIASLAGMTFFDTTECSPSDPVHVVHIHGTFDTVIRYNGGQNGAFFYPSAPGSAEIWAEYNHCSPVSETLPARRDFDTEVMGIETEVRRWKDDCSPGGSAELWTITAGGHIPGLTPDFRRGVVEHLLEHPRCRGREKIKKIRCRSASTVKVKLRKGVPGDSYILQTENGESIEGRLNAKGKATRKVAKETGTVSVLWGCGARASRSYECS